MRSKCAYKVSVTALGLIMLASCAPARGKSARTPAFHENMYAKLLMRAVSGSLYPAETFSANVREESKPDQPYDAEARQQGLDWPSVGHTMIGWKRLENMYEALRVTWEEEIPGDFVELGVWRGGASIFAAGVIEQLNFDRSVWVCDRLVELCCCSSVFFGGKKRR